MKPLYEVNIDFDEASKAWHQNKKKLEEGTYIYVCGKPTLKGTPCQNKPMNGKCVCFKHKNYRNTIYRNEFA